MVHRECGRDVNGRDEAHRVADSAFVVRLRTLVRAWQASARRARRGAADPRTQDRPPRQRRGQEGAERQGPRSRAERQAPGDAGQERQAAEGPHPWRKVRRVAARACCWSAWSACSWSPAASSTSTRRPTSPTPTRTSRPRPRSSTTPTARPSSASSPSRTATSIPLRRDAAERQGRRGRRREPDLLDRQRHRPQGHPARGVQQRLGQRDPGRLDDHPAVRQDPLPHPGALLHAQGEGGDPLAEAAAPADRKERDPRGLPQHHLLRSRRLRHPGGRAGVLRQGRQGPEPAGERGAGQRHQQPDARSTRPTARTPKQALRERYRYVLDGMAEAGRHHAPRRPRRPRGKLPKFPRSRRRRARTAARTATCSTMVQDELLRSPTRSAPSPRTRSTAAACGSPRRSPRRRWTPPRRACTRPRPEGVQRQGPARRGRQRRARHRRGARHLRRPGLPRSPRSTGRSPAARPARRSSRSRWPPASRTGFSLKDTFDGNSPYRARRTAPRFENEGDHDYGSAVNLIKATEDSINTAFIDLTMSHGRRAGEDRRDGERDGHPAEQGPGKHYGFPDQQRRPRARTPASRSASPRSARSTWPTATPPSPTAARLPSRTSSRRSSTRTARRSTTTR